jgi:hypothetical protein
VLRRREAGPRTEAIGRREPSDVPDLGHDGRRGDEPHARDGGEPLDAIVASEQGSELALSLRDLVRQSIDEAEVGFDPSLREQGQRQIL